MEIEIGKVISEKIAAHLKDFTSSQDRADISRKHNVSPSTLREITYRNQSVTENSLPAVKALIERGYQNALEDQEKAKKGHEDLKAVFDTI